MGAPRNAERQPPPWGLLGAGSLASHLGSGFTWPQPVRNRMGTLAKPRSNPQYPAPISAFHMLDTESATFYHSPLASVSLSLNLGPRGHRASPGQPSAPIDLLTSSNFWKPRELNEVGGIPCVQNPQVMLEGMAPTVSQLTPKQAAVDPLGEARIPARPRVGIPREVLPIRPGKDPARLGSLGLRPPAPQEGEPTHARCHLLSPRPRLPHFRSAGRTTGDKRPRFIWELHCVGGS